MVVIKLSVTSLLLIKVLSHFKNSLALFPTALKCLYSELHQVSHKWLFLGVQLGVSISALKWIQMDIRIATNCLPKMLDMWLNCTHTPTWNTVVDALESPPVGELNLAQQLRGKYCPRTGGRVTYEYPSRERALLPGSHLPPSPQPFSEFLGYLVQAAVINRNYQTLVTQRLYHTATYTADQKISDCYTMHKWNNWYLGTSKFF